MARSTSSTGSFDQFTLDHVMSWSGYISHRLACQPGYFPLLRHRVRLEVAAAGQAETQNQRLPAAVAQTVNLLFRRLPSAPGRTTHAAADCQSAIRQTVSLRYLRGREEQSVLNELVSNVLSNLASILA